MYNTRLQHTIGLLCHIAHTTAMTTMPSCLRLGPGDCIYLWSEPFNDQNMAGGVPTRDVTFGDCQDRCIQIPTCLGIDIDNSPDRYAFCWLTVMPGQLSSYPGVTHYQLTRGPTCPEVSKFNWSVLDRRKLKSIYGDRIVLTKTKEQGIF